MKTFTLILAVAFAMVLFDQTWAKANYLEPQEIVAPLSFSVHPADTMGLCVNLSEIINPADPYAYTLTLRVNYFAKTPQVYSLDVFEGPQCDPYDYNTGELLPNITEICSVNEMDSRHYDDYLVVRETCLILDPKDAQDPSQWYLNWQITCLAPFNPLNKCQVAVESWEISVNKYPDLYCGMPADDFFPTC